MVPHNTALPVEVLRRYVTVAHAERHVKVRVVEGESTIASECIQVGSCRIDQLPPGLPKGSPIDVKFSYDNSGRLHVQALEPSSRRCAKVSIHRKVTAAGGASTGGRGDGAGCGGKLGVGMAMGAAAACREM